MFRLVIVVGLFGRLLLAQTTGLDALPELFRSGSHERVLSICREKSEADWETARFYYAARSNFALGRNQEALRLFEVGFHSGKPADTLDVLYKMDYALLLIEISRYREADSVLRATSPITPGALRARLDNVHGILLLRTAQYAQALDVLRRALTQTIVDRDESLSSWILSNIGIVHKGLGDYESAIRTMQASLTINRGRGNMADLAVDYVNLANAYMILNDLPKAEKHYDSAMTCFRTTNDSAGIGLVLGNSAELFERLNRLDAAQDLLDRSLELARRTGDRLGEAEWLAQRGRIRFKKGQWREAETDLKIAYDQFTAIRRPYECAHALIALSDIHAHAGRWRTSDSLLQAVSGMARDNSYLRGISLLRMAVSRVRRNDRASADTLFRKAVSMMELDRERVETPSWSLFFFESERLDVYRSYTRFLIDEGRVDEAVSVFEMAKARALTDRLGPDRRESVTKTAILEYAMIDTTFFLFYKNGSAGWSVQRIGSRSEIESLTMGWLSRLSESTRDTRQRNRLAAELSNRLVPFQKQLEEHSDVVIIPDGILFKLPFESLGEENNRMGGRLRIRYAPGYRAYLSLQRRALARSARTMKAMFLAQGRYEADQGGALPNAVPEALSAAEYFQKENAVLDTNASEWKFKNETGPSFTHIHIAAHSRSGIDHAAILLKSDENEDGYLTQSEIEQLVLSEPLTVLSSCESAAGPVLKSEGMLGLYQSFLMAGASGVIGSLWKVDDQATARFMKYFYEGLAGQKLDAPEALRLARQRSQEYGLSVKDWSAFVLYGE